MKCGSCDSLQHLSTIYTNSFSKSGLVGKNRCKIQDEGGDVTTMTCNNWVAAAKAVSVLMSDLIKLLP